MQLDLLVFYMDNHITTNNYTFTNVFKNFHNNGIPLVFSCIISIVVFSWFLFVQRIEKIKYIDIYNHFNSIIFYNIESSLMFIFFRKYTEPIFFNFLHLPSLENVIKCRKHYFFYLYTTWT